LRGALYRTVQGDEAISKIVHCHKNKHAIP
jgi:hypothetical protein